MYDLDLLQRAERELALRPRPGRPRHGLNPAPPHPYTPARARTCETPRDTAAQAYTTSNSSSTHNKNQRFGSDPATLDTDRTPRPHIRTPRRTASSRRGVRATRPAP
ncbi:hypothetical protein, partial [Streptomyces olivochromogenes]|uniref:hypothetical protein n=1 Tax=Streptomyces olivochromogenes TaxID=1963 RepID=UPI001F2E3362